MSVWWVRLLSAASLLVNPFSGTDAGAPDFGTGGGAGNTYPGATLPFGMLNWSPDTTPSLVNSPGGRRVDRAWLRWRRLRRGGTLDFRITTRPNPSWGAR